MVVSFDTARAERARDRNNSISTVGVEKVRALKTERLRHRVLKPNRRDGMSQYSDIYNKRKASISKSTVLDEKSYSELRLRHQLHRTLISARTS